MRRVHATLLILTLPLMAHAEPLRERVERALSGIEHIPSQQDLLRLGPGVDRVLQQIVARPSRRALARNRAITLLRLFPSKETAATLRRVIETARKSKLGLDQLNLRQALTSYAVTHGPRSLGLLRPFLAHPSMDVRYDAAEAVRLSRSPAALAVLQQRLGLERAPMVKHQLQRQVELIQRPRPASRY